MSVVSCVYQAYQGDVGDWQAIHVHEGVETADDRVSHIKNAMKACLLGWWAANENRSLADEAGLAGKFIAVKHGFVCRITSEGCATYSVEFTSDSLDEAVIEEMFSENGHGNCPNLWPEWFSVTPAANK